MLASHLGGLLAALMAGIIRMRLLKARLDPLVPPGGQ